MLTRRIYPSIYKPFHFKSLPFINNVLNSTSAQKPCLYKMLNVSTDVSAEELKKSYLELAKKYHPDVSTGEKVQEVI